MKWQKVDLMEMRQTGIDELENPIREPVIYDTIKARLSPWTSDDLVLEERSVTQNSRKLITPAKIERLLPAERVKIEGVEYEVAGKRKYGRMRALIVEGFYG